MLTPKVPTGRKRRELWRILIPPGNLSARRAWESHLARAKWMIEHRYRDLVLGQCSALTSRAEVFMVIAWNDFYTARWQRLRKLQLTQHPLCKFCGIVTAENTVDHVVPHHGD